MFIGFYLLLSGSQEYWLHPVIRSEAIKLLRVSEEWEKVNRNAAEFLTEHVKIISDIIDALIVFEAYYHYFEIERFDEASSVILNKRINQFGQNLRLSAILYRLGLFQQLYFATTKVISSLEEKPKSVKLGILYNLLSSMYSGLRNDLTQ